ncbi:MAG: uroporphyrinogen-III synthase [Nitrososphaerales archaeon]
MIAFSNENQSLPLLGRTILITRTEKGNETERQKLESLGAKVVELPTIEIQPPSSWSAIDGAIGTIDGFDWIVFTSANGVRMFFERLEHVSGKKNLKARFACVGPSTKAELERHGVSVSLVPDEFLTEKLGEQLSLNFPMEGKRVLLARAEVASNVISKILKEAGAVVVEAPVYRTYPKKNGGGKDFMGQVTDITLTSPSTVEGLLTSFRPEEIASRKIRVHCIGPVTANRARELGLSVDSTANVHTIEGLTIDLANKGKVET